jgi:hypothetical protein
MAAWHYGSDEQTGTVALIAGSSGHNRLELNLNRGSWAETQSALTDADRKCTWQGFDGVAHGTAFHNCALGVVWFLPQIVLQPGAGAPDGVVSASTKGNGRLHHQRNPTDVDSKATGDFLAQLSASDLDLDVKTGRPVALFFNLHPDNDAGANIPVEVHFSDYHEVQGTALPFHIEKYINHTLVLDLHISEAQVDFVH